MSNQNKPTHSQTQTRHQDSHQPLTPQTSHTPEGNPIQTAELLPAKTPEVTNDEVAELKAKIASLEAAANKTKKPASTEKTKFIKERILDESGDLVTFHVEVPESDPRPGVAFGARLTPDLRDVQAGNPLKDKDGAL